jgi:hypothetical protein
MARVLASRPSRQLVALKSSQRTLSRPSFDDSDPSFQYFLYVLNLSNTLDVMWFGDLGRKEVKWICSDGAASTAAFAKFLRLAMNWRECKLVIYALISSLFTLLSF